MSRFKRLILLMTAIAAISTPAQAYMGAGAGLSAIGSALSFIAVLLLMALGFIWYPVKRLLKRKQGQDTIEDADTNGDGEAEIRNK